MEIEDFTILMKALSDQNRVRGLIALEAGELCVCQIIELLELAPSTVSKHMSILKQAKLVECRKDGRWIYYKLSSKDSEIIQDLIKITIKNVSDSEVVTKDKKKLKIIKKWDLEKFCGRNIK